MALAIGAIVFAGFAPTYYLRPYFHPEPLSPLLHVHGLVFTAWIARLSLSLLRYGPPAFFGLADLFVVACLVYDVASRRRVQPATAWGAVIVVGSQPLRLWLGGTAAWLAFASWVTR
jgi:hypothetical protein